MKILHVIDSLQPKDGGPPAAVVRLSAVQAINGIETSIACRESDGLKAHINSWVKQVPGFNAVNVVPCTIRPSHITRLARAFDVMHVHGVWTPLPTIACWQAERLRMPFLLAPHGMLSSWSLAQKRIRKSVSLRLLWRQLISGATFVHVVNSTEEIEVRARFPGINTRVIPNGIMPEEFADLPASGESLRVVPTLRKGTRFILFLARLHYMKAPDLLLAAFEQLAGTLTDLDLVLAGPDFGMRRKLERQIARAGLADRVHLLGAVYGRDKLALLSDALCLSQPSRHEGLSVSMLEALACGLPIVTTQTANFPEIVREGAGFVVEPEPKALSEALIHLATDSGLRQQMSQAALTLVDRDYILPAVEKRARETYNEAICIASATC